VWSNGPLFFFSAGWLVRGHVTQGACLGVSASLSVLYHASHETKWGKADEAWAVGALGGSLWTLFTCLRLKSRDAALAFAVALCVDLIAGAALFVKAKPLRASRANSASYSHWHSTWHWAVVVGQGILYVAGM